MEIFFQIILCFKYADNELPGIRIPKCHLCRQCLSAWSVHSYLLAVLFSAMTIAGPLIVSVCSLFHFDSITIFICLSLFSYIMLILLRFNIMFQVEEKPRYFILINILENI